MPKNFPLLTTAALGLCAALAFAQETPPAEKAPAKEKAPPRRIVPSTKPAAKPKPTPKASEAPVPEVVATPTPTVKKPSFFSRLFGGRKRAPEPTPTPIPTATPKPRRSPRKPAATPESDSNVKPAPSIAADKPAKTGSTPKTAVAGTKKSEPEVPPDADPEVKEKERFEQAKAKAAADPQVKSLKAKADDAATDDESRKALRTYNKALFEKIRKIDSSVSERATRLEAAILKRLSE